MRRFVSVLVAVCALAIVSQACESDEGGGSSPKAKCEALVEEVCTYYHACGFVTSVSGCVSEGLREGDCDRAVVVTPGYDVCMTILEEAVACPASPSLPADCNDVILLQ